MATMTFTTADVWCKCKANGGKDTQTASIAIAGLPDGATIQRATLNFYVSHTYSTPYINRVSVGSAKVWEDYQPGSGNKRVDVTGLLSGASVALTFYAQNGSSNAKLSNTAFSGISLVVEYIVPKSSFTLDKTSLEAGGSLTVNIARLSSGYTHKVTLKLGTRSMTQTGVATQAVFDLPLDWCDQLPNADQGQGSVTVETFGSGGSLGANTANFVLKVPASVVPAIGSLTAALLDGAALREAARPTKPEDSAEALRRAIPSTGEGLGWANGLYVQGHSRCRLTAGGVAGAYGSTVTSVVISGDGGSGSGTIREGVSPTKPEDSAQAIPQGCTRDAASAVGQAVSWDTHVLRTAGNVTFTATVTDSRGRTAKKTVTITVTPYAPVAITGRVAARCQADGTEDRSGTSIKAGVSYTMTAIGDNAATVRVHWRTGGGPWTEVPDWPAHSGAEQVILADAAALDSAYEVRFTVTDALSTAEQIGAVSVAEAFMVWSKKHKALGLGCYPGGTKRLQMADDWALMAGGRDLASNAHHNVGTIGNSKALWDNLGLVTQFYTPGKMTNQPTDYGNLLTLSWEADVAQLWFRQASGSLYHRQGSIAGWSGSESGDDANGWSEILDSSNWLNKVYPLGSLYLTTDSTSPAARFGGTWTQIKDRFLLAAGGNYGVGSYGGEAYHALTLGELPNVTGSISMHSAGDSTNVHSVSGCFSSGLTNANAYKAGGSKASGSQSVGIINFSLGGSGAGHNNMPPYYAVYMWRRIG